MIDAVHTLARKVCLVLVYILLLYAPKVKKVSMGVHLWFPQESSLSTLITAVMSFLPQVGGKSYKV